MLEVKQVYKTFNPGTINEKTALNGLSLTLADGTSSPSSAATARASPPCSTPWLGCGRWTPAPSPSTAWT